MGVTDGLLAVLVGLGVARLVLTWKSEQRYQRLVDSLAPLWDGALNQFRTMGACATGEPDPTQLSIGLGEMEPTEQDDAPGHDCIRWANVYQRAHGIARVQYPGYRPAVWARAARQALADYLQSENSMG